MRDALATGTEAGPIQEGTRLRDGAVNPHAHDYQPPVHAGMGLDPHGPAVVSVQAESPRSGNAPDVADPEEVAT